MVLLKLLPDLTLLSSEAKEEDEEEQEQKCAKAAYYRADYHAQIGGFSRSSLWVGVAVRLGRERSCHGVIGERDRTERRKRRTT